MSKRQVIPIAPNFFCDGHYYLLTSSSLGGSGLTPEALSNTLRGAVPSEIRHLLRQGVCLPLFFDGDCALDGCTVFVVGDLTEPEDNDWIGKLTSLLKIPCGKLVLLCGGGDAAELAEAISGNPPKPNYEIFQTIEVPPGDYQVEIYAYLSSMTVQLYLSDYDEAGNLEDNEAAERWYETHRPGLENVSYIIRLIPLKGEPPEPALVPDIDWCGEFEFRPPELE